MEIAFTIPVWLMWLVGVPLVLFILCMAAVGASWYGWLDWFWDSLAGLLEYFEDRQKEKRIKQ